MLTLLFLTLSAKFLLIQLSFQNYRNLNGEINHCISYSSHSNNIGCSSKFQGSSGEIYLIKNISDIDTFVNYQSNLKYIIVIHADVLSIENIQKLESSNRIAGIVVFIIKGKRPETQSYENTCLDQPNDYYSNYSQYRNCTENVWNPHGQNMMERSYSYPMTIIKNQADISLITSCYENKNAKNIYPKCGLSMNIFMNSFSMTTPECVRKDEHYFGLNENRFCFNLAAQNIYVPFSSQNLSSKYVVVSTKLDTRCLFSEACLGANSELTSVIVFLSMINTLSKFKNEILNNTKNNILFVGFDGESWDSIGSSVFAYDLSNNNFRLFNELNAESIESWIEIGPLGLYQDSYYIHSDPILMKINETAEKVKKIAGEIKNKFNDTGLESSFLFNFSNKTPPIPPCSLRQILRHGLNIPSVYLADFNETFSNKFYHGIFDDSENVKITTDNLKDNTVIKRLSNVSKALTQALFALIGIESDKLEFNTTLDEITGLAECFFIKSNCALFEKIHHSDFKKSFTSDSPFSRETVVSGTFSPYIFSLKSYIAYGVGIKHNKSSSDCQYKNTSLLNYDTDEECVINATVYQSSIVSLYFNSPKFENYSSWMISAHSLPTIKLYYIVSQTQLVINLIFGIIITSACIILPILIRKNKDKFFKTE